MTRSAPFALVTAAVGVLLASSALLAQQTLPVGAPSDVTMGLKRDPALAAAIAEISAAQIRATDSTLVWFGTRHTMSDTTSNSRGIGAARRYLFNKLTDYSKACGGCLRVEYDPAMMEMRGHPQRPTVNVVNVIAWLPGRDTSRVVVMGGHYDSCICARADLGPLP